ncbi:hypothetical protein [Planctomyces sp. SH-PL14]|uniref:hypothetical protein n=1 Tax=Planctomyces sp. SH-PL14 TaxID=1632864 RepID=UPI00078CDD95|nr:hypothetical protein [Planctomyces sp. SH-PL14]AMV18890.1 hypothetical protein VT03_13455 [Planctomyces sp. SH-PL14]
MPIRTLEKSFGEDLGKYPPGQCDIVILALSSTLTTEFAEHRCAFRIDPDYRRCIQRCVREMAVAGRPDHYLLRWGRVKTVLDEGYPSSILPPSALK